MVSAAGVVARGNIVSRVWYFAWRVGQRHQFSLCNGESIGINFVRSSADFIVPDHPTMDRSVLSNILYC